MLQGDALYAMELALSLEKLNFIKLRELHRVAANCEDAQLADFIGESQDHTSSVLRQSCLVSIFPLPKSVFDGDMFNK